MPKIVITGATSFIGKNLTLKALQQGYDVIAVVRRGTDPKRVAKGAKIIELSMDQYEKIGQEVGTSDCFVHLAWMGTRGDSRMDRDLQRENCRLSVSAVRSMLEVGCNRIITGGSQAEYGHHSDVITEETECAPNTEYGKWKLEFFHQIQNLCEETDVEYKEPRFFSVYGPGDFEATMISSVLEKMRENLPCDLTECTQKWDFLYVSDAADALLRLCVHSCPNGIYNLGSGDIRTLKEYVLEMARITNTQSQIRFGAVPYPKTGCVSIQPDVSKIKKYLDWAPKVSFEAGIKEMLHVIDGERLCI